MMQFVVGAQRAQSLLINRLRKGPFLHFSSMQALQQMVFRWRLHFLF